MKALLNFLRKAIGASEHEADALRLKTLLKDISQKEGRFGSPFIDLGGGKVLRQSEFKPYQSGNRATDAWKMHEVGGDDYRPIGRFHVDSGSHSPAEMSLADLNKEHRGKGLGKQAYRALADHYGGLWSDELQTSEAARHVWESLGGKPQGKVNVAGQNRFYIEGRPLPPRWGIFEDD